jgi:uncharacterized protein
MKPEVATIEELPAPVCLRLLEGDAHKVGRVGYVLNRMPVILPVNYLLFHGQVVFRTEPGTVLDELTRRGQIDAAFQADALDPGWREGWSVLLQGRVRQVLSEQRLERLRALPLRPWAPGHRSRYLELEPRHITGRRIG